MMGKPFAFTLKSIFLTKSLKGVSFLSFVSQAEFSEINLASYVNSGCMVDMQVNKGGTKVVR